MEPFASEAVGNHSGNYSFAGRLDRFVVSGSTLIGALRNTKPCSAKIPDIAAHLPRQGTRVRSYRRSRAEGGARRQDGGLASSRAMPSVFCFPRTSAEQTPVQPTQHVRGVRPCRPRAALDLGSGARSLVRRSCRSHFNASRERVDPTEVPAVMIRVRAEEAAGLSPAGSARVDPALGKDIEKRGQFPQERPPQDR